MFNRRKGDLNSGKFWRWFAGEAQGLSMGIEALARGEADADWLLAGLCSQIRRYDASMQADIVRAVDGSCELHLFGGTDASLNALIVAAPALPGWRIMAHAPEASRVPYRRAPRPSMDLLGLIEGRHEAYAH